MREHSGENINYKDIPVREKLDELRREIIIKNKKVSEEKEENKPTIEK